MGKKGTMLENIHCVGCGELTDVTNYKGPESVMPKIVDKVAQDFIHKLSILVDENITIPSSLVVYSMFTSRFGFEIGWMIDGERVKLDDYKIEKEVMKKYGEIYFPGDTKKMFNLFSPGEWPFMVYYLTYDQHHKRVFYCYDITR